MEAVACVSAEADHVAVCLEAESHVEVFGHSRLGPVLLTAVVEAVVGDPLDSCPAKHGIVADERRDVTRGHGVANLRVDEVGEERDAALEEGFRDVHDAGSVLENSDVGALLHLGHTVDETVLRHASVRVDEQDVVAHTDVTVGPGAALVFFEHFGESVSVCLGFVFLRPAVVPLEGVQLVLHAVAGPHGIVHV